MSEARNYFRDVETLDNGNVEAAYARWAPIYDLTFDVLLKPGRRAAAAAASARADPFSTSASAPDSNCRCSRGDTQVVGVDLSEPMLRRAAQRVRRERLAHVAGLVKMDATRMAFADASFACVVAPYVLTVVPEPAGDARRTRARAAAGRRDRARQSRERQGRRQSRCSKPGSTAIWRRSSAGARNSPGRSSAIGSTGTRR